MITWYIPGVNHVYSKEYQVTWRGKGMSQKMVRCEVSNWGTKLRTDRIALAGSYRGTCDISTVEAHAAGWRR